VVRSDRGGATAAQALRSISSRRLAFSWTPTTCSACSPSAKRISVGTLPDAELLGDRLVLVDVEFRHRGVALGGDVLDDWLEHVARATPVRVEVDQQEVVILAELGEVVLALDVDRLVGRGRPVGDLGRVGFAHRDSVVRRGEKR